MAPTIDSQRLIWFHLRIGLHSRNSLSRAKSNARFPRRVIRRLLANLVGLSNVILNNLSYLLNEQLPILEISPAYVGICRTHGEGVPN